MFLDFKLPYTVTSYILNISTCLEYDTIQGLPRCWGMCCFTSLLHNWNIKVHVIYFYNRMCALIPNTIKTENDTSHLLELFLQSRLLILHLRFYSHHQTLMFTAPYMQSNPAPINPTNRAPDWCHEVFLLPNPGLWLLPAGSSSSSCAAVSLRLHW